MLGTIRAMVERIALSSSVDQLCADAAEMLGQHPDDLPFGLIYLADADSGTARLAGSWGTAPGGPGPPAAIRLDDRTSWPTGKAVSTPELILIAHGVDPPGLLDLIASQLGAAMAAMRARAQQTAFLANVSHEFRTPLALLLGPLEDLLEDQEGLTPAHRDRVATAHRSALRLLKLTNTLLDFFQVQAERSPASFQPVALPALTAELAGVFRSAIEREGLRLVVDCPPLPWPIHVDVEMWEKIIFNLLSNAFKFTFDGEITVSVRALDNAAEVTIADTGAGIPEAELPHLFDRYHRVRSSRARTSEGSGIGLSLVHELVELHAATIAVDSVDGDGTTITITIPTGTAHLPADAIAKPARRSAAVSGAPFVQEALRWTDGRQRDVLRRDRMRRAGTPQADDTSGAELLVVDDDADMRDYLRRILGEHFEVRTAGDGASALESLTDSPPDLVLTDVMVPGMSGVELLKRLRANEITRDLPVILFSAMAGEEAMVAGLDAGADDYLVKPFTATELVARVRANLTTARLRRQLAERMREVADASHALTTSLRAEEICRVVVDLVLPEHGLWCAVWLVRTDELGNERIQLHQHGIRAAHAGHGAFDADGAAVRGPLGVDDCLRTLHTITKSLTGAGWPAELPVVDGTIAVTVPMRARGRVVGAITCGRAERDAGEIEDLRYLEELAKRAALAFANAAMYEAEHRVALGLQRSLLPRVLPRVPGLRLAARYLPGAHGTWVGGDWYDSISLPHGRLGLVIGDVVGHGIQAAARMGQLRTALRSYAVRSDSPAQVLDQLDSFVVNAGEVRFATCLYAMFHPGTGELQVANAGHLQPLLLIPGAAPRYVDAGTGIPLGGASQLVSGSGERSAFSTRTVTMPTGSALVMYTDGLVETKTRALDEGLDRLRAGLRGEFASPEEICDRALRVMEIGETCPDDTTVLVIRRQ